MQLTIGNFFRINRKSISIFFITFIVFSIINVHEMQVYDYWEKKFPAAGSLNLITGEEPYYLVVTSTIIRHHSVFAEDFFLDKNPDPILIFPSEFHVRPTDPGAWHAFQLDDGHYIIGDGPGLSYILIPGYFVGGIFGALTTMSLASSFTSVLIYQFSSRLTNTRISIATTLIFTFATLLLIYSNQIYADVVMMLFLIFSVYVIFERNESSVYMTATGVMLGFGVFLKATFFLIDVILLFLVAILFIKHKISYKNFLLFVSFFIMLSFLAVLNNVYSYHSLLGQANTLDALNFLSGKNAGTLQYNYSNGSFHFDALLNTLFGTYNGLFIFSPIVLLFAFGIGPLWNKNRLLLITTVILSLIIIGEYIITNPLGFLVAGDPPYRYLIPFVPLMAIPFALGLQKFSRNLIYLILLSFFLVVSTAFSFGFILMGRFSSLQHDVAKTEIVHLIYGGVEYLFPTLGPSKWSYLLMPENHPMNTYNVIFVAAIMSILSIGILISFLQKSSRISLLLFYFCLIILLGIVLLPILSGQTKIFESELHPISYYKFENNTLDSGLLKNNGTVLGKAIYVNGNLGKAFEFQGNNSIIIQNEQDYNFEKTDPFSISFWIKPVKDVHEEAVVNKLPWVSGAKGWRITIVPDLILFRITDNHLKDDIVLPCTGFSYGEWHNFVFTYDGNGMTGGTRCYIDGKLRATGGSGNLTSSISNEVPLTIGADPTGQSHFTGQMNNIMIFNKNLSENEINYLYYGFLQPNLIYVIVLLVSIIVSIIFTSHKRTEVRGNLVEF